MVLEVIIYIAFVIITLIAAVMIRQLWYAAHHFVPPVHRALSTKSEDSLPTVSVCIPARNEQHALTECLEAVLRSDYPKLEVIVLDDVSGDDTSALIKSFASEGVRFVQGQPLPRGWLGKNHALQGLLDQASGEFVLYLGVDTRVSTHAIKNIVRYALSENATMVSVLPRREDGWRMSVLFSPLRFFWELIFHRRLWPATASSTWLIRRSTLNSRFQGIKTFKEAIQPETKIATELAATGEYRFIISTSIFGFSYEKKWRSQLLTSIRLLYPLLYQQPALAAVAVFDLFLLLSPTIVLLTLFAAPFYSLRFVALILYVVYAGIYGFYTRRVWQKGWFVGALLWPVLVFQEIILVLTSMVQYWRGAVTWKGRSIRLEPLKKQPEA